MNRGVEILIARMKSNPDEFKPNDYQLGGGVGGSAWDNLLDRWKHCLTEEEVTAFRDALKETHRELFSQEVMKHILHKGERQEFVEETMSMTGLSQAPYQHPYNTQAIGLAQPATYQPQLRVGQEIVDEDMVKHMKEHLKQLKMAGKI